MSLASGPDAKHGPRALDLSKPSAARAYDYYLGGAHNFEADRELAHRAITIVPNIRTITGNNRSFLRRVVRYLVGQGIHQFVDIGSGIPTVGNVHEVAQKTYPEARVVYVDYEPVAYQHAHGILQDNPWATIIQADLREPTAILEHPDTRRLIDFSEPVGLLMVGVLLFIPDEDDPAGLVRTYRECLSSGSYFAASHITDENVPDDLRTQLTEFVNIYNDADEQIFMRDRATFASWFEGLELVPPGVTYLPDWHPEEPIDVGDPARLTGYGGLGYLA